MKICLTKHLSLPLHWYIFGAPKTERIFWEQWERADDFFQNLMLHLSLCVCVSRHQCGGQETACGSHFSPSTVGSGHRSFRASTFSPRAILLAQEHRLSLKVFYTTYCSLAAIETQRQQVLSLLWGEEVIVMFNSGPVMKGWKVTLRQNLREFSLNKPSVLTEDSFIQTEVWRTGRKNM